jgi:hypothetical protein
MLFEAWPAVLARIPKTTTAANARFIVSSPTATA